MLPIFSYTFNLFGNCTFASFFNLKTVKKANIKEKVSSFNKSILSLPLSKNVESQYRSIVALNSYYCLLQAQTCSFVQKLFELCFFYPDHPFFVARGPTYLLSCKTLLFHSNLQYFIISWSSMTMIPDKLVLYLFERIPN